MEQITLGQIGTIVAFLVTLITGLGFLLKKLKEFISNSLTKEFEDIGKRFDTIDGKMDELSSRIEDTDMNATKNFLVRFLADVEQGQILDGVEWARFWEQYDHYTKCGGNSYIKEKVEEFKTKGLLNH